MGGDLDLEALEPKFGRVAKPRVMVQPSKVIGSPRREGAKQYIFRAGLERKWLATQVSPDGGAIVHRQMNLATVRSILDRRYQVFPARLLTQPH